MSLERFLFQIIRKPFYLVFTSIMPRKNAGTIFCSNGTKIDLHPALLKAMITSEDQKEKFACALQNACPVIIERAQGKRLETFSYGPFKTELHH